jgi:hypothetical protein
MVGGPRPGCARAGSVERGEGISSTHEDVSHTARVNNVS